MCTEQNPYPHAEGYSYVNLVVSMRLGTTTVPIGETRRDGEGQIALSVT